MYKLADGSLSTDYKIGDEFEVVGGHYCFDKGEVVTLKRDGGSVSPYFDHNNCVNWGKLKPHRKQFTKADLKDGMVVTIMDGREAVVYKGILNEVKRDIFTRNRLIDITNYCDNLTSISGRHCYDAMKVSYMGETLWEREEETVEQKEIKRLRGVIEDAQKALSKLEG